MWVSSAVFFIVSYGRNTCCLFIALAITEEWGDGLPEGEIEVVQFRRSRLPPRGFCSLLKGFTVPRQKRKTPSRRNDCQWLLKTRRVHSIPATASRHFISYLSTCECFRLSDTCLLHTKSIIIFTQIEYIGRKWQLFPFDLCVNVEWTRMQANNFCSLGDYVTPNTTFGLSPWNGPVNEAILLHWVWVEKHFVHHHHHHHTLHYLTSIKVEYEEGPEVFTTIENFSASCPPEIGGSILWNWSTTTLSSTGEDRCLLRAKHSSREEVTQMLHKDNPPANDFLMSLWWEICFSNGFLKKVHRMRTDTPFDDDSICHKVLRHNFLNIICFILWEIACHQF